MVKGAIQIYLFDFTNDDGGTDSESFGAYFSSVGLRPGIPDTRLDDFRKKECFIDKVYKVMLLVWFL